MSLRLSLHQSAGSEQFIVRVRQVGPLLGEYSMIEAQCGVVVQSRVTRLSAML
jgi:hypothetical protein